MRSQVTYSFEREDGGALSLDRLEQAYNQLSGFLTADELDPKSVHPGVKALRMIRGNVFSREAVDAFGDLVAELSARAAERVSVLEAECAEVASDEKSVKAYEGLIEMIESGRKGAERDFGGFLVAFEEEARPPSP